VDTGTSSGREVRGKGGRINCARSMRDVLGGGERADEQGSGRDRPGVLPSLGSLGLPKEQSKETGREGRWGERGGGLRRDHEQ